jgi:predicted extracellular nuclease
MKNLLITAVVTILFSFGCTGSKAQDKEKGEYLLMFYNVENLFDTIDNPNKRDEDFSPEGRKQWGQKRYEKKLNDLAKVIDAVGGKRHADIIGLCEVENRTVVEALANHELLKSADYQIIHFESPDERGIDVALLFRKATVQKSYAENILTRFAWDSEDKTRDILYAKLHLSDKDLHVFVNHWSSRGGGLEKTAPKRMRSAALVRSKIDSIQAKDEDPYIVVMGDMNDEPENLSVQRILYANGSIDGCSESLYNMAWIPYKRGEGTYHYWRENKWNMLDQIIVSRNLIMQDSGLKVTTKEQKIFKPDWLLHENEDGIKVPDKTFGKGYYGGFSDHLPVYIYLN